MATSSSPGYPQEPAWKKEEFLQTILNWDESKASHLNILTPEKYASLLQEVLDAKTTKKKTTLQYRRLKRFDIIEIGGEKKLIAKSDTGKVRYYLSIAEIFDVIAAFHLAIGHGGRDRLKCAIAKKYANVTADMIMLFLSMCEVCRSKKTKKKKEMISIPIIHSDLNSRCQVDLLDMQTLVDGEYKFIMVYEDHLTKFVILRALQSMCADEVAYQLVDIFSVFGAPCILQSENGEEFVNNVIKSIGSLWPELKIVRGKSKLNQSQRSVKTTYQDIENLLSRWMKDNSTTKWSEGLRYVQFRRNRTKKSGLNQSPYKAMFGVEARVGLVTTGLPLELVKGLDSEEALEKVVNFCKETKNVTYDNLLSTDEFSFDESSPIKSEVMFCCVCAKEADGSHSCANCGFCIHVTCGIEIENKGFGSEVMCPNCNSEAQLSHVQQVAVNSLETQTKKLKTSFEV